MKALAIGGLLAALMWSTPERALALDVPPLRARVNDYAQVLTPQRAQALEAKLAAYEQRSGHQLALLTIESLQGDAIEPFAMRVVEQWKLGDAKRDDGLLLIVVPKERKLRIEVGYGLEGTVPDAIAARVIREIIAPAFQRGDYAGGIDSAFDALMRAASGEAPPEVEPVAPERAPQRSPFGLLILLIFIFVMFTMTRGGRRGGGMWLGPLIGAGMSQMGGSRRGGGGFGGGGGGRFGGGGASGGW